MAIRFWPPYYLACSKKRHKFFLLAIWLFSIAFFFIIYIFFYIFLRFIRRIEARFRSNQVDYWRCRSLEVGYRFSIDNVDVQCNSNHFLFIRFFNFITYLLLILKLYFIYMFCLLLFFFKKKIVVVEDFNIKYEHGCEKLKKWIRVWKLVQSQYSDLHKFVVAHKSDCETGSIDKKR